MSTIFHDKTSYRNGKEIDELAVEETSSGSALITIKTVIQHNEVESVEDQLSYTVDAENIDKLIDALKLLKLKNKP